MIWVFTGLFTLLIFPIFVKISIIVKFDYSALYFNISLYGLIDVFYGKAKLSDNTINLWLRSKKEKVYPLNIIFKLNKPFKPLNDYHFISFNSLVEMGVEEITCEGLMVAQAVNQLYGYVTDYFSSTKPYLKIKNDIIIEEKTKKLRIYLDKVLVLNLLMILISLIKIMGEKIIYAIRKKQNKRCG